MCKHAMNPEPDDSTSFYSPFLPWVSLGARTLAVSVEPRTRCGNYIWRQHFLWHGGGHCLIWRGTVFISSTLWVRACVWTTEGRRQRRLEANAISNVYPTKLLWKRQTVPWHHCWYGDMIALEGEMGTFNRQGAIGPWEHQSIGCQ